jgi:HEPN domain-containing protein
MREEIQNWLKQAEKDLRAAKNSLKSGDFEWASFQSQQAAEKALKALFISKKRSFPQTHDLVKIGGKLKVPKSLMVSLRELNPEYTIARYPNAANAAPFEIYYKEKARDRINHGEKVLKWIKKQLK